MVSRRCGRRRGRPVLIELGVCPTHPIPIGHRATATTAATGAATGAQLELGGGVGVSVELTLLEIISDAFLATRMPMRVVIEPVIKSTMSFNILV
jgi:hypothetical protein